MLSLIARTTSTAAAAELLATNAKCVVARAMSTDGPQRSSTFNKNSNRKNAGSNKGRNLLFGDDKKQRNSNNAVATADGNKDSKPQYRKKKTFSFSNSKNAPKEPEAELEVFDYPAYWSEDFPEGFDDSMKHEVEKLQIFADFTPYLDCMYIVFPLPVRISVGCGVVVLILVLFCVQCRGKRRSTSCSTAKPSR